ncbi:hypothetical protein LIER_20559 [Lithospermum erythrorhizon]|uniref:Nuclease HARBI1 n=1 Tax=Lithospermum erythrorhizon TaxID=34254 RepID=A0AAV3QR09_LITER
MHWVWTQWSGMYSGRNGKPTIILEVVASYDTCIWHAFFGLPGSHNDINVLERSSVFNDVAKGDAPKVQYSIRGHDYNMGYYLADGIYSNWATFLKSIPAPIGNKKKYFVRVHESLRKDVELAFGILQSRFSIVRCPARYFNKDDLKEIMMACIIMHNMIVENERDMDQEAT